VRSQDDESRKEKALIVSHIPTPPTCVTAALPSWRVRIGVRFAAALLVPSTAATAPSTPPAPAPSTAGAWHTLQRAVAIRFAWALAFAVGGRPGFLAVACSATPASSAASPLVTIRIGTQLLERALVGCQCFVRYTRLGQ
jgi:hypothetical protein